MAFEYQNNGEVSEKTDSYAFGVVILELLTGQPPRDKQRHTTLTLQMARALDNPRPMLLSFLDCRAGPWPGPGDIGAHPRAAGSATQRRDASNRSTQFKCDGVDVLSRYTQAVALATIARRCLEHNARQRCSVLDVLPEIDALAKRPIMDFGAYDTHSNRPHGKPAKFRSRFGSLWKNNVLHHR